MKFLQKKCLVIVLFALMCVPVSVRAQNTEQVLRAKVVEVVSEEVVSDGISGEYAVQVLKAEIRDGARKGDIVSLTNDFSTLDVGDRFFISYTPAVDGEQDSYVVIERDRRVALLGFFPGYFYMEPEESHTGNLLYFQYE